MKYSFYRKANNSQEIEFWFNFRTFIYSICPKSMKEYYRESTSFYTI